MLDNEFTLETLAEHQLNSSQEMYSGELSTPHPPQSETPTEDNNASSTPGGDTAKEATTPLPRPATQVKKRRIYSSHPRDKGVACARFLQTGQCPIHNCPYMHINAETRMPVPSAVCGYYLRARCLRDQCPFYHLPQARLDALVASGAKEYAPLDGVPVRDPLDSLPSGATLLSAAELTGGRAPLPAAPTPTVQPRGAPLVTLAPVPSPHFSPLPYVAPSPSTASLPMLPAMGNPPQQQQLPPYYTQPPYQHAHPHPHSHHPHHGLTPAFGSFHQHPTPQQQPLTPLSSAHASLTSFPASSSTGVPPHYVTLPPSSAFGVQSPMQHAVYLPTSQPPTPLHMQQQQQHQLQTYIAAPDPFSMTAYQAPPSQHIPQQQPPSPPGMPLHHHHHHHHHQQQQQPSSQQHVYYVMVPSSNAPQPADLSQLPPPPPPPQQQQFQLHHVHQSQLPLGWHPYP